MTTLHLGVIDIPYTYDEKRKNRKGKLKSSTSMTTGDVADILEEKYHVMEIFWEANQEVIMDKLNESLAGALESAAMGAPMSDDMFAAGAQGIQEMFKDFILSQKVEQMGIPGTPTKAALRGISHRKAHPYAKANPRRPSFYDTGMYVDHFTAWVD